MDYSETSEQSYLYREIEIPFGFPEIFFSRTDTRGKIQAGNEVFQRISGYSWSELAGKPHNIIRHEGVPRAVFWLLWDRLRQGLQTGAYVKNKSKEGRFYWVYAIITPCEGGFLSVRIKPSSAIFGVVQAEYASLVQIEAEEKLPPAESAARLMARLAVLGFESYDAFMATSLAAEFSGRDESLQKPPRQTLALYERLMPAAARLLAAARQISEGYLTYRFVPLNLLVHAGQIGETGAAIATISTNYNTLSEEIEQGLERFLDAALKVSHTINVGAVLLATSYVQQEIASSFREEVPIEGVDHATEKNYLDQQQSTYQSEALKSLTGIEQELKSFFEMVSEMKRLASGLAAIRIMGKVESGRLSVAVVNDLIMDLEAFQDIVQAGLSDILQANDALRMGTSRLLEAYATEDV